MTSPRAETTITPLAQEVTEYWRAGLNAPVPQQPNEEQEIQLIPGPGIGQVLS